MANDLQTSADLNSCRCCSSDLNPPCIARQMGKEVIPDKDFITKIYIHNLTELVKLAGLEKDRKDLATRDKDFDIYWAIAKDWSEQSRYEEKQIADAQYLLESILNEEHGVMQWIKRHW